MIVIHSTPPPRLSRVRAGRRDEANRAERTAGKARFVASSVRVYIERHAGDDDAKRERGH